ncbi:MAG: cell envelope integrity protein CreD [Desulfovibrio sp.]|nr:cell envelope integrity protein CreD [Desulfovibrio sp.]
MNTVPEMNETPKKTKKNGASAFIPEFFHISKNGSFGLLFRCLLIIGITLLLQLPLSMVQEKVREREYLFKQAAHNIAASWGETQTVSGPLLIIPYVALEDYTENITELVEITINGRAKEVERSRQETRQRPVTRHKVILPSHIRFATELDTEIRYRGIYRQTLYTAPVAIEGDFTLPEPGLFDARLQEVHWDKAWLAVGVTDPKGIIETGPLRWEGGILTAYSPGTKAERILGSGFHAPAPIRSPMPGEPKASSSAQKNAEKNPSRTNISFSLSLKLRGSAGIFFTPVGETSVIKLSGVWPNPSFQGNLLPVERNIGPGGFSAQWNISNLTRSYPQIGDLSGSEFIGNVIPTSTAGSKEFTGRVIPAFTAGVDLYETVSLYRMIQRAIRYDILFIAVSFVALFSFEIGAGRRMHLIQYGVVGLSMTLFYLTLLSLAEHVLFGGAFAAATAVTVIMNSLYVAAVLRNTKHGMIMAALLAGLHGVLFCLLRMEDFALLMGTGLLLVMMGALMVVTKSLPQQRG